MFQLYNPSPIPAPPPLRPLSLSTMNSLPDHPVWFYNASGPHFAQWRNDLLTLPLLLQPYNYPRTLDQLPPLTHASTSTETPFLSPELTSYTRHLPITLRIITHLRRWLSFSPPPERSLQCPHRGPKAEAVSFSCQPPVSIRPSERRSGPLPPSLLHLAIGRETQAK